MKKITRPTHKTIKKTLFTVYAFVSICITTFMIDRMFSNDYPSISQHVSLNDSWDITINRTIGTFHLTSSVLISSTKAIPSP